MFSGRPPDHHDLSSSVLKPGEVENIPDYNYQVKSMKICIPAKGPEPQDLVDERFGRAPYFLIYNTDTSTTESFKNPAAEAMGGVGPRAAQFLFDHDVHVLVTARVGGNALEALKAGGVTILLYEKTGSTVEDAITAYSRGGLREQ
jgi:predicted Fe-Mo cluster-binding NifX family protein